MATYIVLAHFSDQGIRGVKDSPKRADAFQALAKKAGANVKELYWTLGSYDGKGSRTNSNTSRQIPQGD